MPTPPRKTYLHLRFIYRILNSVVFRSRKFCPARVQLEVMYLYKFGKRINLKNPQTYNEKLQWLKLYYHEPLYTKLVDKILVKEWVAEKIGMEYIIPTLATYDNPKDIDFKILPNQFVLKCNHNSGCLCICKNKSDLDIKKTVSKLSKGLKEDYYLMAREWPYKNVKRKIIAEQYLSDLDSDDIKDYKFFCFNGKPIYMFVACDRNTKGEEPKFDFFDMDFNHLSIKHGHPNSKNKTPKPITFEKMKELASILSQGMPHVRVDFYEINGKVFFGEMTFYHHSGLVPFIPESWDKTFGDLIILPEKIL